MCNSAGFSFLSFLYFLHGVGFDVAFWRIDMIYLYRIERGVVFLTKSTNGADVDTAPKKIGSFKSDADAKEACFSHHGKACKIAHARGDKSPQILFN
jgi:hypothetical protein